MASAAQSVCAAQIAVTVLQETHHPVICPPHKDVAVFLIGAKERCAVGQTLIPVILRVADQFPPGFIKRLTLIQAVVFQRIAHNPHRRFGAFVILVICTYTGPVGAKQDSLCISVYKIAGMRR